MAIKHPRGARADYVNPAVASQAKARPRTIDEYLATVADDKRAALQRLRKTIRSIVPKAEECISYGLAAFRLNGRPLIAFGAARDHCALYPMSSATVKTHQAELKRYDTSKGTIRFQADNPLPVALVRKLVKARIAESRAHRPDGD
jgi:uncharacterized protein YdhG (YjbR/CyaY superfamily)